MKQIFVILMVLSTTLAGYSQQDTASAVAIDSASPTSTFTLGLSVVNNADYYGQRSQETIPYASIVASYKHHSGFVVNALSYRLLDKKGYGFGTAYGVGCGFEVDLRKSWKADFGYQYTFFPQHSPFLQAANPHSATASLSKSGVITATLEGNYSFGKTNDFFSTLTLSKQVAQFSFSKKDIVIFTPQIDVTGGTQHFYSYYVKEKSIRDSLAGALLDPIFGVRNPNTADTTSEVFTSFDLLSYNLKVPIAYSRANYLIELSAQFSLLSNKAQIQPGQLNTFLTASFYYQF